MTENNDLKWNRAKLTGTRLPGDDPSKQNLANAGQYQLGKVKSLKRLAYDFVVVTDHVGAEFEIQYRWNGNCIRDVVITNTSYAPPGPLSGRNVTVETDITGASEYERGDVAAVQVDVVYHFSNVAGSQGTFVHRIILFGDGRTPVETWTER